MRNRRSRSAAAFFGRRGFSIVYVGLVLFLMLALVSLAVDMGRLRVARVQLQTATDAGALAGAQQVPWIWKNGSSVPQNDAVTVAAENVAIQGTGNAVPVTLIASQDIELGLYQAAASPPSFTKVGSAQPGGSTVQLNQANAVHVTGRRTAARGTPVGLFFARALGLNTMDVTCQAIAVARGYSSNPFGLIGLDWVSLNGNTSTDGYNPVLGAYGGSNVNQTAGTVASNGTISLVGTADVWGDGRYGPGIPNPYESGIHGWQAPLDGPLSYPAATVPAGVSVTSFSSYKSGKLYTLPGGSASSPQRYWFTSMIMNGNSDLTTSGSGYVEIYVTGNVDMTGGSSGGSAPPLPEKIALFVVGAHQVDIGGGSDLYAHVYAPQSDVRFHGTNKGGFYGWIVGKTLDIKGNSQLHYDMSLGGPSSKPRAALVK